MGCNMSFESHTILEHTNLAEIIKIKESKVYDEIMVNIVSDEINQALDSNDKKFIILDFSKVKYLSSSFLGKIISINKKVKAKEGKLFLAGLNVDIMEVFQITKLEKFFNFQSSVESALDSI